MKKRNHTLSASESITLFGKKIAVQDIAAAAVFLVLFGWFFYVVRFGVNAADEGFYYNIAQRVLQGDRLLVDEWQVSQFSSFLLLLPYRLYTAAAGSAEGVILFGRYLYVAVTGALYWWLYSRYRRFGFCGLIGVALFCAFVPGDMFAVFYLTMTLQGLMVLCTLLFVPSEKPLSLFGWAFCGVVLACVVLANPPLCVLYAVYCVCVLLCRVRRSEKVREVPALQPRAWLFLTVGVAATAIPVVLYLLLKSGVHEILRIFPELFTDAEYDFGAEHIYNLFWKFLYLCKNFGWVNAVLWGALLILGAVVRRLQKSERGAKRPGDACGGKKGADPRFSADRFRRVVFLLACVLLAVTYVTGIVRFAEYKSDTGSHQLYMYYFYHSAPLMAFCAVCGLLRRQKDTLFSAFWWTVLIAEGLISYGSQVSCSICGVLLFPYAVSNAFSLLRETEQAPEPKGKRVRTAGRGYRRAFGKAAIAAGLCAVFCFESIGIYVQRFLFPVEYYESGLPDRSLDTALDLGPLKGLITNGEIAEVYGACLDDLAQLRESGEAPVYITGACPYLYLYLDTEMGTYSSWYVDDDAFSRQLRYMQLLPEKQPAAVYIPFCDFITYRVPDAAEEGADALPYEQKLAWVRRYADCDVAEGRMGYIVHIKEWHLPQTD